MKTAKTKKYSHLFFDLDDTLVKNRSRITKRMRTLLESLPHDIVIVSGATIEEIEEQTDHFESFMLGQNGNHAMFGDEELWRDTLKPDKIVEIMDHATSMKFDWDIPDKSDLLFDKGCMISYSVYGFNAPKEEKDAFDSDRSKRKKLLEKHPLKSENIEVNISGSTTFDYTRKGSNKGTNITRLIERLGWEKDDCVYFGDSLQEHGNDFSVIGVIDTIEVENPADTYKKLQKMLESR